MRRFVVLGLAAVIAAMLGAGATALAVQPRGGHDDGPYAACVNMKTGTIRMVDAGSLLRSCTPTEYSISWANGFQISNYTNRNFFGEHTTATSWFHQLACPEGSEPLGGGGAFLSDVYTERAQMALQSSVPTVDEDLGGLHGWEVSFGSVDGLPHSGQFQVFVICAPAHAVD